MISLSSYKSYLSSQGSTLGEVKRAHSDYNINNSFTRSTEYKKAYILTENGWKWEDIHFFRHVKQSITADAGDNYLQFRPRVHYPIGTYVIIPDDLNTETNLTIEELSNPFLQPEDKRTQWWILVQHNNTNYPLYNALQCNWTFKWIYNNKIYESFGCARNANSYTNGVWNDEMSWSLNDINSFIVPDTYFLYKEKLSSLKLYDTRTITHEQRFFISNNELYPDLYMVSKINNTVPAGLIKVTLKSDDFDPSRDNTELKIADYYSDSGHSNINTSDNNEIIDNTKKSEIIKMKINSLGILEVDYPVNTTEIEELYLGQSSYYSVVFSDNNTDFDWKLELLTDTNTLEKSKEYYENLVKIYDFDETIVNIKPSKASSLIGLQFKLSVSDSKNNYYSYAILEVKK